MKWSRKWIYDRKDQRIAQQQDQDIHCLRNYYQDVKRLYRRTKHRPVVSAHHLITYLASSGQRGNYTTRRLSDGAIQDIEQEGTTDRSIRSKANQLASGFDSRKAQHPTLDHVYQHEVLITLGNLLMEAQVEELTERGRTWRAPHNQVVQALLKAAGIAIGLFIVGMVFVLGASPYHRFGAMLFWVLSIPSASVMVTLPFFPISRVHKLRISRYGIIVTTLSLCEALLDFFI